MNAKTFPTARELLQEITDPAASSHTVEGQQQKVQYLLDFVNTWGLGQARVHPYPAGSPLSDKGLANLTVDVGGENGYDELLLGIAHCDVVKPRPGQEQGWNGDVFSQRGSADMLGQLSGFLLAMRGLVVGSRRKFRLLVTTSEEMYSEGAFAAGDDRNNLTAGASAIITTDINVGTRVTDDPELVVGGVGRVAGMFTFADDPRHSGGIRDEDVPGLISDREAQLKLLLPRMAFTGHARDNTNLFPKGRAVARAWGGDFDGSSSLPTKAWLFAEVHHGDEGKSAQVIMDEVTARAAEVLGRGAFTFQAEDRGGVPFSQPWLTDTNHPLVSSAMHYAAISNGRPVRQTVYGGSSDARFVNDGATKPSGRTATTRLTKDGIVPMVGYYASGEGVHTAKERVDVRSIEKLAAFLKMMAEHDGSLTD